MRNVTWTTLVVGMLVGCLLAGPVQTPEAGIAATPLAAQDLDDGALAQWVDGQTKPVELRDGARHLVWTRNSAVQWNGVSFGDSKQPGPRHLRIGFKQARPVGAVLTRGGGSLSILKSGAAYPGDPADESQWLPAQRLSGRAVGGEQAARDEYALWTLPPGTRTRALRFTHTAQLMDKSYAGWLGGVYVLSQRLANIAPQAIAAASARDEAASRLNNGRDEQWSHWDNGKDGAEQAVDEQRPEWIMLVWPAKVRVGGLCALWAGFSACEVQAYAGPDDRHPRSAAEGEWKSAGRFSGIDGQYPRVLGVNWLAFDQPVTTRALRVRITGATKENHPHLNNKTQGGKRIWLSELMALTPLESADLSAAVLPAATEESHPPIPVRFALKEPGVVTLVIEDSAGKRIRNLVSQTPFPAGENVAWWDGMDDLGRDPQAAKHGIYHTPGQFVAPGAYRVRGLVHKGLDLRYEFSVYCNGGKPAWSTADNTGGWLTNHTPPSAALFVPADRSPSGQEMIYLGSYVAEGGHGLAWFDLDAKKIGGRGWVGGTWTGAPYLARDAGAKADAETYTYVGAAWEGELRLTALTKKGDKNVAPFKFPGGKPETAITGLAVHDGLLACSLPKLKQLLFVDAKGGKVIGAAPMDDPRGVMFNARGRLLVLSGKTLHRYDVADAPALPKPEVLIADGLEDPQQVAADASGNLYISDRGNSHQIKVFTPEGKPLRAIGRPGAPKAGPYDPLHMNNPRGLAIDSRGRLWVTEEDYQPKRVSVWTLDGSLVNAFYGPSEYGGGGALDPRDKTRFYYHGMEFRLDWEKGTDTLAQVLYRPGPADQRLPDGHHADGHPQSALYRGGQRYFTNCFNSNPTNGSAIAMLWIDRGGIAVPAAALGRAADWNILTGEAFKSRWPAGVNVAGDRWKNPAMFAWSDLNEDGHVQPEEVQFEKTQAGGITVMEDFAFIASRVTDRVVRYAPMRFTAKGVPVYELASGETLVSGAQNPPSSGGDQALHHPDGWTVMSNAPKPFSNYSLGGAYKGEPRWCYPSPWPGLHASHESPAPSFPGMVIGTTRLLGSFVTPRQGDAGPLWCINGNQGNMYLFTVDGLFVAEMFNDVRLGRSWSMPVAQRNMLLNELTLHDENFWPTITQTADGQVYLVDGARTSLVRVDGLDRIQRLADFTLNITQDHLKAAQAFVVDRESRRQKAAGEQTLVVAIKPAAPKMDGVLDDWAGADWASVDKRGVKAYFNSDSKPYDVSAAVAISGDRLFVAFRAGEKDLLKNAGGVANAPFKTGGALDLMISANSSADTKRTRPAEGDQRLLVTMVNGKPLAMLYRAVVPGTKEPVPFSSPWRTITIDRVEDVTAEVSFASADGNYEFSVPLPRLGLKPAPGMRLKGDLGILRGNGFQTLHRVYWNNKATGITADVPSEAELTPALWGTFIVEQRK